MNPVFRVAKDKDFAERLTRHNMALYYERLEMKWDSALFKKNWNEFENYEIAINGQPVGLLRLSHNDTTYFIRDLQILEAWQGQGLGSQAIHYASEIARTAGFKRLRLRVFRFNPAASLYHRLGFRIRETDDDVIPPKSNRSFE